MCLTNIVVDVRLTVSSVFYGQKTILNRQSRLTVSWADVWYSQVFVFKHREFIVYIDLCCFALVLLADRDEPGPREQCVGLVAGTRLIHLI